MLLTWIQNSIKTSSNDWLITWEVQTLINISLPIFPDWDVQGNSWCCHNKVDKGNNLSKIY